MLLSLTDHYLAGIAPGSVTLQRMRRGWRPSVVHKSHASSETRSGDAPWLAELGLLDGLLSKAQRGLPLSITLSNHYVRYRLVPAPPLSMPLADVQALLRHCFRDTYGDIADAWQIRANPLPDSGDVVACAVDRALLDGLKAMAEKYGLRLVSAEPCLMSGFNVVCRRIGGQAACFVQSEPGRIMLGMLRDKKWLGLRALAATPQWKAELPAHIEREILLAGWENINPGIFLHTPDTVQVLTLQELQRWKPDPVLSRRSEVYSLRQDAPVTMALSEVQ